MVDSARMRQKTVIELIHNNKIIKSEITKRHNELIS